MGRIRTIKPEFPQSESMGRVSRDARLTFVLLWTVADDEGRLRGNPALLAGLLFPYDDDARKKLDGWLAELEREDCIERYKVGADSYIAIANWREHQKIDRASPSRLPAPSDGDRASPREPSTNPREPSTQDRDLDLDREGTIDGDDRARVADAKRSVMEAMGVLDDPRWLGDGGRVEAWMNSGADIHRDILPTIKSVMAKRGAQGPPSSLKYFDRAVMDAHATRTTPAKPGTPHAAPSSRDQTELRRAGLAAAFNEFAGADPGSHRPD